MATVKGVFQPLFEDDRHGSILNHIMSRPWAENIIVASAFANSNGVTHITENLSRKSIEANVELYLGIGNGVTTLQALWDLFKTGCDLYVVNTGSITPLYHPKFCCAFSNERAQVLIGSSNLTHPGLFNNLEASALIELDLAVNEDQAFLDKLLTGLQRLKSSNPDNCYQITHHRSLITLNNEGFLVDERTPKRVTVANGSGGGANNQTPTQKIDLPFTPPSRRRVKRIRPPRTMATTVTPAPPLNITYGNLLWEKPNLPRGDLQLLRANQGHATGVLRLTQARFNLNGVRIDQTTYFRNDVFGGLQWATDTSDPEKEIAHTYFTVITGGNFRGTFNLKLSHKPTWESGQGNYTTALHWGDAKPSIQQENLVGRKLGLYQPAGRGDPFVIIID